MRGGALPLLCWAGLLTLAGALNAAWAGDLIQVGTVTAAVLIIGGTAVALIVRDHDAVRRGAPRPRQGPEAITRASFAAAFTAVGLGVMAFGFAFGHFPIYLGAGMMLAGGGRLVLELQAQRSALKAAATGREPPAEGGREPRAEVGRDPQAEGADSEEIREESR